MPTVSEYTSPPADFAIASYTKEIRRLIYESCEVRREVEHTQDCGLPCHKSTQCYNVDLTLANAESSGSTEPLAANTVVAGIVAACSFCCSPLASPVRRPCHPDRALVLLALARPGYVRLRSLSRFHRRASRLLLLVPLLSDVDQRSKTMLQLRL